MYVRLWMICLCMCVGHMSSTHVDIPMYMYLMHLSYVCVVYMYADMNDLVHTYACCVYAVCTCVSMCCTFVLCYVYYLCVGMDAKPRRA